MNEFKVRLTAVIIACCALLTACSYLPEANQSDEPEVLTIYPDGSMRLMGRPVPPEDVVIYPDGFGGEKAAVKISIEPLHPPFYRDTIIVERVERVENSDDPEN